MIATFVIAALLSTLVGIPVRYGLVRFGILDRPNARSSHSTPTARGGGLGFVGILVAVLLVGSAADPTLGFLALAAVGLGFVGFVDDLRSIGVRPRMACHLVAACVPTLAFAIAGHRDSSGIALAVVAFVGTVGFTNAFNFMDGINGLAATDATIAFVATAFLASVAGSEHSTVVCFVGLAGATVGFLPWNVPRARMFMGDVGSTPLGYLLAATMVLVVRDGGLRMVLPLALVHLGFVLDAGITFFRRLHRGERVLEAHREHFYQRLVRSGAGHGAVTSAYSVLTSAAAAAACAIPGRSRGFATFVAISVVAAWFALFGFAEARFRRTLSRPGESA